MLNFLVMLFTMLGLQEIAVAMSDPFGDDDADFDTSRLIAHAYDNVVEYTNEVHNPNDSEDADLVFERKHFQDFGISIHGDEREDSDSDDGR